MATAEGRTTICEKLLSSRADPNVLNSDFGSPLHVSAAKNHCVVGRLLLRNGASSNVRNVDGETPLMIAARKGRIEAVRLLLDHSNDLDPYLRDYVVGNTALHESSLYGHDEISKLLLSRFPKLASVRNTLYRQTASVNRLIGFR